jgi:hypothetical protein
MTTAAPYPPCASPATAVDASSRSAECSQPSPDRASLEGGRAAPSETVDAATPLHSDQSAPSPAPPGARPRLLRIAPDLLAWLGLALATLAVLWPLGLTNRILAGIDAFTYFTPYWDYRMAAMRSLDVPLWNPYLFNGAPFLANIQAAVLYPLHWPLSWLKVEQALVWSAILHCWLAAGFTYTYARRSFTVLRSAAFLAGLLFGLGGFAVARVENINQLNGLAWLPALLWLHDETRLARAMPTRILAWAGLAAVIALQLLAGHTQTTFINMVGWALYAGTQCLTDAVRRERPPGGSVYLNRRLFPHLLPFAALIPGVLLAAAQLLPTLELNDLGLRTGGLSYREAVSFSLRPRLLLQTFLPPFGGELAGAYASEGYGEFLGYVGLAGLVLAGMGAWCGASRRTAPLVLAVGGAFLALGAYNPLYVVLWRIVPGFDVFRAPARWLALFSLGVAVLAALGMDSLGRSNLRRISLPRRRASRIAGTVATVALVALLAWQQWPPWQTLAAWGVAAALVLTLTRSPWKAGHRGIARIALTGLALIELFLAGRALPFTEATAPMATSLRNAPASLLAATAGQPAPGRDRFLSLSDIRYDPGDLADLRALQADRLSPAAVERLVRAAKQVEVLAPNLSLYYRLPAADGYDGGLLPLHRYVELQGLFLPPDTLVPDGRLREQLAHVPPDRLLDLTGVRFVITDKQRDLWANDVYYDLELSATVAPGQELVLDLSTYPRFAADSVGIVAEASGTTAGIRVGELLVIGSDGAEHQLPMTAGSEVATAGMEPLTPAVLPFSADPCAVASITIRNTTSAPLVIRGLSLIDAETRAHTSITVSPRGDFRRLHSGDVKLYDRRSALGRAWLVHGIAPAAAGDAAESIADPGFDPARSAVVEGDIAARPPAPMQPGESATVAEYTAERVQINATVQEPALLLLADAWYPGWEATVDGAPAPILRANLLFRGVTLEPGEHAVVFNFRSQPWERGRAITLVTLGLLIVVVAWALVSPGYRHRL